MPLRALRVLIRLVLRVLRQCPCLDRRRHLLTVVRPTVFRCRTCVVTCLSLLLVLPLPVLVIRAVSMLRRLQLLLSSRLRRAPWCMARVRYLTCRRLSRSWTNRDRRLVRACCPLVLCSLWLVLLNVIRVACSLLLMSTCPLSNLLSPSCNLLSGVLFLLRPRSNRLCPLARCLDRSLKCLRVRCAELRRVPSEFRCIVNRRVRLPRRWVLRCIWLRCLCRSLCRVSSNLCRLALRVTSLRVFRNRRCDLLTRLRLSLCRLFSLINLLLSWA